MNTRKKWIKIAAVALSSGLSQALTLVFGILLVRVLTMKEYAVYRQGMLIVNMLSPFLCVLSPISLSYFLAKEETEDGRKYYVRQTVFTFLLISFVVSLSVFFLRELFSISYNNQMLSSYMLYFAIILFTEGSTQYFAYYMVCINKEKIMVTVTIIFSFLKTFALIVTILLHENYLKVFMRIYTSIEIFRFVFIIGYTYLINKTAGFCLIKERLKLQLVFSMPVYIMGIINAINLNLDKNIVAMIFSSEQYAIYENGAYQIPFIGILSSSIISVMLPDIAQKFKAGDQGALNRIVSEYKDVIKVSYGILFAVYLSIYVFSEGIVIILFSAKYMASLPVFKNYLLMILLQSFNLGVLLTSADRQKDIVKTGFIMLGCNFGLLLILAKTHELVLLSFAPIVATIIMNILLLFFICKVYKQPGPYNIIPVKFIAKLVMPGIGISLLFRLLLRISPFGLILNTMILGPVCFFVLASISFVFIQQEKRINKK